MATNSKLSDNRGHLIFFLHAHLPFVRHPEDEHFLEEDWLYEAITETYIPLLAMVERWHHEDISARLTFSLTPPLLEMLRDDLLMSRYARRMHLLLDLAEREVCRNSADERFRFTAELYRERLADTLERFEKHYSRDLVAAFGALQDAGTIEIVASGATHAFLPGLNLESARAQIRLGIQAYREHLGRNPPGIWLPECGFVPGIDRLLAEEGLSYFFVDSHAVEFAEPSPVFATYSPIVCPSAVFAFPRDLESSAQVWSSEFGYPGDGRYREFYRDIGHDLPEHDLAPFLLPNGGRKNVGIKYHRITGREVQLRDKEPYHRGWALEAVEQHAEHFVRSRMMQMDWWNQRMDRPPIVVAPYDAELFGHWWFEGPEFLDLVVRKVAAGQFPFRLSSPTDAMACGLEFQVAMPARSSWGAYGYFDTWVNDKTLGLWPHIHRATREMTKLADERLSAENLERRALNQLAREVLLASSSDWPFILTMGTMVPYAERRVRTHINRFNALLKQLRDRDIDETWLSKIEASDNIFPYIDYRAFASQQKRKRQESVF